ncbi:MULTISPECIES: hypothetical protein [Flammeovirga]|uniref:Uncharacterized protein n=1 Tax=Flammeovirga agarivorans TaxID=2726742 RepID=A0A7X8SP06_9BACT|nr:MULTISPECIES: hypothetical protein [Flammeovirga]NLR93637.1 hypothetical protein [Flammeovirga agarivorans]
MPDKKNFLVGVTFLIMIVLSISLFIKGKDAELQAKESKKLQQLYSVEKEKVSALQEKLKECRAQNK